MKIEVISFGKIMEIIGRQILHVDQVRTVDEFRTYLEHQFPPLREMPYQLALNQEMVKTDHQLKNNDVIAVMPPFSGG